jgi:hypothetical protein
MSKLNIRPDTATSAIWNVTWRPWLMTLGPILISFSRRLVSPRLHRLGQRQRPHEIAEVVGERMELETESVGGEGAA